MSVNPKLLGTTAVQSFGDDFNSLSLYNGTVGTWETSYPWQDRLGNGGSLNDEQQWYINSRYPPTANIKPWSVSGGILTITASPAPVAVQGLINGYKYTSGVMTTYKSFNQLYGYFECSAQLPKGQGFWPAFWMDQAGTFDWPATGTWPPEVDVFEVLGRDVTTLYQTVHTGQTNSSIGKVSTVPDMSAGYHTYGVGWWDDFTIFYFDRNEMFRQPTPGDMHKPMFVMLDLALGGGWGGPVDASTPFPAQMKVDYVRAYKSADGSVLAPSAGQVTPQPPPPPPPTPGSTVLTGQVTGSDGSKWSVQITRSGG